MPRRRSATAARRSGSRRRVAPDGRWARRSWGAAFVASPGAPLELLDVGISAPIPYLPGISTATELMAAHERGYDHVKFFPAAAAGGVAMLKALAGPFPKVHFCATGGVTRQSAPHYLAQPNVTCVGGSWLAPVSLVEAGDWEAIEQVARATVDDLSISPHQGRKLRG